MTTATLDWYESSFAANDLLERVFGVRALTKAPFNPLVEADFLKLINGFAADLTRVSAPIELDHVEKAINKMNVDWTVLSDSQRSRVLKAANGEMRKMTRPAVKATSRRFDNHVETVAKGTRTATKQKFNMKFQPDFNTVDQKVLDNIAKDQGLFVTNRYGNQHKTFSVQSKKIVDAGLAKGLRSEEIAVDLAASAQKYGTLRTGSYWRVLASAYSNRSRTYAQFASYADAGIQSYRFEAVMDERTTEQCRFLDGKIFQVKDALAKHRESESTKDPQDVKTVTPWVRTRTIEEGKDAGKTELYVTDKDGGNERSVATVQQSGAGKLDDPGKFSSAMSEKQLMNEGIAQPPLHGLCRSTVVPVLTDAPTKQPQAPARPSRATPPPRLPRLPPAASDAPPPRGAAPAGKRFETNRKFARSLTDEEREIIEDWTDIGYTDMRRVDAGLSTAADFISSTGQTIEGWNLQVVQEQVDAVYRMLDKAPHYQGKVYRTLGNLDPAEARKMVQAGSEMETQALSSWTADEGVARGFQSTGNDGAKEFISFYNPKGFKTGAHDFVDDVIEEMHESEVLVRKGKKFRVVKATRVQKVGGRGGFGWQVEVEEVLPQGMQVPKPKPGAPKPGAPVSDPLKLTPKNIAALTEDQRKEAISSLLDLAADADANTKRKIRVKLRALGHKGGVKAPPKPTPPKPTPPKPTPPKPTPPKPTPPKPTPPKPTPLTDPLKLTPKQIAALTEDQRKQAIIDIIEAAKTGDAKTKQRARGLLRKLGHKGGLKVDPRTSDGGPPKPKPKAPKAPKPKAPKAPKPSEGTSPFKLKDPDAPLPKNPVPNPPPPASFNELARMRKAKAAGHDLGRVGKPAPPGFRIETLGTEASVEEAKRNVKSAIDQFMASGKGVTQHTELLDQVEAMIRREFDEALFVGDIERISKRFGVDTRISWGADDNFSMLWGRGKDKNLRAAFELEPDDVMRMKDVTARIMSRQAVYGDAYKTASSQLAEANLANKYYADHAHKVLEAQGFARAGDKGLATAENRMMLNFTSPKRQVAILKQRGKFGYAKEILDSSFNASAGYEGMTINLEACFSKNKVQQAAERMAWGDGRRASATVQGVNWRDWKDNGLRTGWSTNRYAFTTEAVKKIESTGVVSRAQVTKAGLNTIDHEMGHWLQNSLMDKGNFTQFGVGMEPNANRKPGPLSVFAKKNNALRKRWNKMTWKTSKKDPSKQGARHFGNYTWGDSKVKLTTGELQELQSYVSDYATTKNFGDINPGTTTQAVELFAESTAMFTSAVRKDVLAKLKESRFGDLYTFYDDLLDSAMKDAQGIK